MFGLGHIKFFAGPITVAVFGSIILKNIQEMFWDSASEVTQLIIFRRSGNGGRNDDGIRKSLKRRK